MLKITEMYTGINNGLIAETQRYGILILVFWLNYAECSNLTCVADNNLVQYDPNTQLCCKGIHSRVQNGREMGCCNGTLCPRNSHSSCTSSIYKQDSGHLCCGNNLHDVNDVNQTLVCCGDNVYYKGKGTCCAGKFYVRTGNIPLVCMNGVAVDKSSLTRRLEILNVKTTTTVSPAVRSELLFCGNVTHPKKSDTYRYDCCEGVIHQTPHIDPDADYTMECCGSKIYNTSKGVCCNDQLLETDVKPIDCCNNKDIYLTTTHICCGDKVADKRTNLCVKQIGSRKKLVMKDDVNHDKVCFNRSEMKFRTFNSKTHTCDNQLIVDIVKVIKNDKPQTSKVKPQPRILPPKCPSCITGNSSGPSECRRRNKLNFRITTIEERQSGRLWLHVNVTRPRRYAGRQLTLKTRSAFPNCFKEAWPMLYSQTGGWMSCRKSLNLMEWMS